MKEILGKLGRFAKKLKGIRLVLPILLVVLILHFPDTAFAADAISEDTFHNFLQKWGQFLALIGSLINVVLWVVISFVSDLLSNDFIFGANMEDMLLSIWQTVRNLVNIVFVFVLLVIAFYNVVSIDTEKFSLKKSLGKVAIALILVNFSYFAAKVVLDVANVLTTAVFAIPRDIIAETDLATSDEQILEMCWKRSYFDEGTGGALEEDFPPETIMEEPDTGRRYALVKLNCHIPNLVRIQMFGQGVDKAENIEDAGGDPPIVASEYEGLKVLLLYKDSEAVDENSQVINITEKENEALRGADIDQINNALAKARLEVDDFGKDTITMVLAKTLFDLNKLSEVTAAASKSFMAMTISGIVNLTLLLLYGVMFVAMFIVLLFRVVYLWVCIAFSPLVALTFVFKDFGLDMGEFDIQKIFIQYAFVPVKMGVAISAGTLMIFKANQMVEKGDVAEVSQSSTAFDIPLSFMVNETSVQKLMWQIATVAVMWIAIKWSMKDLSGPVSTITDKIFGYVGSLGNIAARTPLVLPIAPYFDSKKDGRTQPTSLGEALYGMSSRNLRSQLDKRIYRTGAGGDGKADKVKADVTRAIETAGTGRKELGEIAASKTMMGSMYNDIDNQNRRDFITNLQQSNLISDNKAYQDYSKTGFSKEAFPRFIAEMDSRERDNVFGNADAGALLSAWGGKIDRPNAGVEGIEKHLEDPEKRSSWREANPDIAGLKADTDRWNPRMQEVLTAQEQDGMVSMAATRQMVTDINTQLDGLERPVDPITIGEAEQALAAYGRDADRVLTAYRRNGGRDPAGAGTPPPAGGGAAAAGGAVDPAAGVETPPE
ncbi:hypothetical protein HOG48_04890 [Candidatus Peregrinibacteria bacterium]|nr:hypothetical protein [Candidatus Peregrinibacteria bacterium]